MSVNRMGLQVVNGKRVKGNEMVSERSQWSETHLFLLNLTHSEEFVKWLEKFDPGNGAIEILLPMTTATVALVCKLLYHDHSPVKCYIPAFDKLLVFLEETFLSFLIELFFFFSK